MVKEHCTIYKTDGTGRDTYIFSNNGGFSVMNQPKTYDKPGSFLPRVQRYREKRPVLHSKAVNYRQDGTGRDSYIMIGNGGYTNPGRHQEYREAFKRSLRSYERSTGIGFYRPSKPSALIQRSVMNATMMNERLKSIDRSMDKTMMQTINAGQSRNQDQTLTIDRDYTPTNALHTTAQTQMPHTQTFTSTRNSLKTLTALVVDNPTAIRQRLMAKYQQTLDQRLSVPKVKKDDGETFSPERTSTSLNRTSKRFKLKKIPFEERQQLFKAYLENSSLPASTHQTLDKQQQ